MRREDHPFKPGERSLIKIEPLFATDYAQARALLRFDSESTPLERDCSSRALFFRGLAFWQHWLPCQLHVAPSVYVAKEDGVLLGLIVLRSVGKTKLCWQIDHLIVHPHHRGRGIAQELLRYAFALFGSQGASHFITEVSDLNSAGLQLYGSCGFRRCAKVTHYQLEFTPEPEDSAVEETWRQFRLAKPADRQALFQLHQEALPADIRLVMNYCAEDFTVSEFRLECSEALRRRVMRKQGWYVVAEDVERRVLTCAAKVYAHDPGDFHLEMAIHPGWSDLAYGMVGYCVSELKRMGDPGRLSVKAFDYQTNLGQILKDHSMTRVGEFCFLAREHWVRAKNSNKLKLDRQLGLPSLPNPAVNLPRIFNERPRYE